MNKLKEAIAELRNINTNDPALQRRIVKVVDQLVIELEKVQHPKVYRNFGGQ